MEPWRAIEVLEEHAHALAELDELFINHVAVAGRVLERVLGGWTVDLGPTLAFAGRSKAPSVAPDEQGSWSIVKVSPQFIVVPSTEPGRSVSGPHEPEPALRVLSNPPPPPSELSPRAQDTLYRWMRRCDPIAARALALRATSRVPAIWRARVTQLEASAPELEDALVGPVSVAAAALGVLETGPVPDHLRDLLRTLHRPGPLQTRIDALVRSFA